MNYTPENVLKIAKRVNNTKRSYLLVNPLQAKHIPVSPKRALEMMRSLGNMLYGKYPEAKLVIGFAETATAIGAAACESFTDDCVYIHTTRESFGGEFVYFSEEHSHAVEQKLYASGLDELIRKTPQIIFIDDELSTGKTLINIAERLKKEFPCAEEKEFIAASILNRISEENEARLLCEGIKCEQLVKLPNEDHTVAVEHIEVEEAEKITSNGKEKYTVLQCSEKIPNARMGVKTGYYKRRIKELMRDAVRSLELPKNAELLVLGTEECMYPALVFGEIFEEENGGRVLCHSTTRSPIGISHAESYPIKSGYKLRSFYESSRETFIYNLGKYENAIVISDSADFSAGAEDLAATLLKNGCGNIFYLGVD
ncbi:MAG: phosphoribosyltransferase domain-containing protein [Oscillospiraceae bacterium]|nr:phosphoribosyltransferase domain-containing protein [Oscillospiraceae bacterium]